MWKFVNTVKSGQFEYSKNWTHSNQTISQTTFKAKLPSEQNLEKILSDNLNSHWLEQICISLPCLSSDLSYEESTAAAPISFH